MKLCDIGQIICEKRSFKTKTRDFPCGPVVKNLFANAGSMGSIPGL